MLSLSDYERSRADRSLDPLTPKQICTPSSTSTKGQEVWLVINSSRVTTCEYRPGYLSAFLQARACEVAERGSGLQGASTGLQTMETLSVSRECADRIKQC
jgi:hypothetical protein